MIVERLPENEGAVARIGMFLNDTFAKEFSFGGLQTGKIEGRKAYNFIWRNLATGGVWIARDGDRIIGSIALYRTTLWWSDTEYLKDGWLYVVPEHRNAGTAIALLRAAEAYAMDEGLPLVLTVMNSEGLDRKTRFLAKMGYAPVGGLYLKGQ